MAVSKAENEVIDLLKTDSKGWAVALFQDQNKITTYLCENCNHICCEAVELACDHDETDIYLYCKNCLNNLIENNDNKCPVNSHSDPEISPNRAIRRQVLKSRVYCPYSAQYTSQNIKQNMDNVQMIDTIGGPDDEKEGVTFNYKRNESKCNWNGTLHDLIKTHITECVKKNDPIFTQHMTIKKLKDENKNLRVTVDIQQKKIEELREQIMALTADLTKQTSQNQQLQNDAMKLYHKLDKQDTQITEKVNILQKQISSTEKQMHQLKNENEKLTNVSNDLHSVIRDKEQLIKELQQQIITLTAKANQSSQKNEEIIKKLKIENETINKQLNEQSILIQDLIQTKNDDERKQIDESKELHQCNQALRNELETIKQKLQKKTTDFVKLNSQLNEHKDTKFVTNLNQSTQNKVQNNDDNWGDFNPYDSQNNDDHDNSNDNNSDDDNWGDFDHDNSNDINSDDNNDNSNDDWGDFDNNHDSNDNNDSNNNNSNDNDNNDNSNDFDNNNDDDNSNDINSDDDNWCDFDEKKEKTSYNYKFDLFDAKKFKLENNNRVIKGLGSCSGYFVYLAPLGRDVKRGFTKGIHFCSVSCEDALKCYRYFGVYSKRETKYIKLEKSTAGSGYKHNDAKLFAYLHGGFNKWKIDAIWTVKLNCNNWTVTWYNDTTSIETQHIKPNNEYYFIMQICASEKSYFEIVETPAI